jgi:hypothetical protein
MGGEKGRWLYLKKATLNLALASISYCSYRLSLDLFNVGHHMFFLSHLFVLFSQLSSSILTSFIFLVLLAR